MEKKEEHLLNELHRNDREKEAIRRKHNVSQERQAEQNKREVALQQGFAKLAEQMKLLSVKQQQLETEARQQQDQRALLEKNHVSPSQDELSARAKEDSDIAHKQALLDERHKELQQESSRLQAERDSLAKERAQREKQYSAFENQRISVEQELSSKQAALEEEKKAAFALKEALDQEAQRVAARKQDLADEAKRQQQVKSRIELANPSAFDSDFNVSGKKRRVAAAPMDEQSVVVPIDEQSVVVPSEFQVFNGIRISTSWIWSLLVLNGNQSRSGG